MFRSTPSGPSDRHHRDPSSGSGVSLLFLDLQPVRYRLVGNLPGGVGTEAEGAGSVGLAPLDSLRSIR